MGGDPNADGHSVDTETGEYLEAGERTLEELAEDTRRLLDAHDRNEWDVGRNLAQAWAKLNGSKNAYGEWCSANIADQPDRTLLNYRTRFKVFGHRRE